MRRAFVFIGALSALMSAAYANIIHEDNVYWLSGVGSTGKTYLVNPDTATLNANLNLLTVKVEETVYDLDQSALLQKAIGITPPFPGYLYTYTVANLHLTDAAGALLPIADFAAFWGAGLTNAHGVVAPTAGAWVPLATGFPAWSAAAAPFEVPVGSAVGGLWAFSPSNQDAIIPAAVSIVDANGNVTIIDGFTTGPVPEPGTIAALATGFVGLLGLRRRK